MNATPDVTAFLGSVASVAQLKSPEKGHRWIVRIIDVREGSQMVLIRGCHQFGRDRWVDLANLCNPRTKKPLVPAIAPLVKCPACKGQGMRLVSLIETVPCAECGGAKLVEQNNPPARSEGCGRGTGSKAATN